MIDIAALATAAAACCTVLAFGIRFADRITRSETIVGTISDELKEIEHRLSEIGGKLDGTGREIHERVTALAAALGLHREHVAREYVNRDTVRDVEERLVSAIEKSERSTTLAIDRLAERVETLNNGHIRKRTIRP